MNFEINMIVFLHDEKVKEKFKYLENNIFIIFKGLSVAKNCLRPESAPVKIVISCIKTVYSRN